MLAKVTVVKTANENTSVCGDVAAYISGFLLVWCGDMATYVSGSLLVWCVYVAPFGSSLGVCTLHCSEVDYFRKVQRTHTNKDPLIYAATSPHTDVF